MTKSASGRLAGYPGHSDFTPPEELVTVRFDTGGRLRMNVQAPPVSLLSGQPFLSEKHFHLGPAEEHLHMKRA